MSKASQQAAIQSQISSAQSKKEGYLEEAKKVKGDSSLSDFLTYFEQKYGK